MEEDKLDIDEKELINQMIEEAKKNGDDWLHLEIFIPKMQEETDRMISTPITIVSGNANPYLIHSLIHTMRDVEGNLLEDHPEVAIKMMLDKLRGNEPTTETHKHKRSENND